MILRVTVLALLLANLAYFSWAQGYLLAWGLAPARQSEPQRLAQQIRPEAVRLRPLQGMTGETGPDTATTGAGPAAECLATGVLDDSRATALRQLLAAWPAGSWSLSPATETPRWIVYMGRYAGPEQVERKKAELRRRGVRFEPVSSPALEPGLSLGGFQDEAQARQYLDQLVSRGVRTGTVVQERPERQGVALRLPAVNAALQPRLEALRAALGDQALRSCP